MDPETPASQNKHSVTDFSISFPFITKPTLFRASQETQNLINFIFFYGKVVRQDQFVTHLLSDAPICARTVL
jgi:hypothetical protein